MNQTIPLLRCKNHPDRAATIRCDECGRLYCRECVAERWITSRSSVWVCNRCTGSWRPRSGASSGPSRAPLGSAIPSRYVPIGLIVAVVALVAAAQAGGLLGH